MTHDIGLRRRVKITLDVIWVPFDDRFGDVLDRFTEHSRYLDECAKVANFKTERERYEDLKRELKLLRDTQKQQGVDMGAMAQTSPDLRNALLDAQANVERLLKEESESLRVSRELEERATSTFRERMRGLDGVLRAQIESENKRHTGSLYINYWFHTILTAPRFQIFQDSGMA